jgi:hypothetical protein
VVGDASVLVLLVMPCLLFVFIDYRLEILHQRSDVFELEGCLFRFLFISQFLISFGIAFTLNLFGLRLLLLSWFFVELIFELVVVFVAAIV